MKWKLFGFGVITGAAFSILYPYFLKSKKRKDEVDQENHETDNETSSIIMDFTKECEEVKDCVQTFLNTLKEEGVSLDSLREESGKTKTRKQKKNTSHPKNAG